MSIEKQEIRDLVLGDDPAKVAKWHKLFEDEVWIPRFNVPLNQQRDDAFKKLSAISKSKLISVKNFFDNPKNIFLAHEFVA